jgi:enamine deaminase RidA (YjgF/YER057c/UK114 family)
VSTHEFLNPAGMAPAVGFSHVAVAAPGRLVFVAGQTAHQADGRLVGDNVEEQFEAAVANVVAALAAAGAEPAHVVALQIFTSDVDGYRAALKPIGRAYQAAFGGHYPPMALFGVTRLFDEAALVELVATAVIPAD